MSSNNKINENYSYKKYFQNIDKNIDSRSKWNDIDNVEFCEIVCVGGGGQLEISRAQPSLREGMRISDDYDFPLQPI